MERKIKSNEKVTAKLEEQSQDSFPKSLTSKRLIGGRQQKIFLSICALIFIGVSGLVLYSCNKEKPVAELLPDPKSSTVTVDEKLIKEAHDIMVDFFLKSKNASVRNSVGFENICKDGDGAALMQFIGYSAKEADDIGRRLIYICTKINESNGVIPSANQGSCTVCDLEAFHIGLSALDDEVIKRPKMNWEVFFACLGGCAMDCFPLSYCPACYAACVAACTGICYYCATSM